MYVVAQDWPEQWRNQAKKEKKYVFLGFLDLFVLQSWRAGKRFFWRPFEDASEGFPRRPSLVSQISRLCSTVLLVCEPTVQVLIENQRLQCPLFLHYHLIRPVLLSSTKRHRSFPGSHSLARSPSAAVGLSHS